MKHVQHLAHQTSLTMPKQAVTGEKVAHGTKLAEGKKAAEENAAAEKKVLEEEAAPGQKAREADWTPGFTKSDPYCRCEVKGNGQAHRVETAAIHKTSDPVWDHSCELPYAPGDSLVFSIYDKDFGKQDDFLGAVTLESHQFYPHGFEGEVPLSEAGERIEACLALRILPAAAKVQRSLEQEVSGDGQERTRREHVERMLEAEQAKVAQLREALIAAEEQAQLVEHTIQASSVVSNAPFMMPAVAPNRPNGNSPVELHSADCISSDVTAAGVPVNIRDLAWENAGSGETSPTYSGQVQFGRQLSSGSLDRVFQGAASDDISALTAALDSEEDVIEAVLKARDNMGRTVLQAAIVSGALEAAKFLCAEGQKWTKKRQFMFELQGQLLERDLGRFINGRDHDGRGALSLLCSASKSSRESVILLLESQADPMQRDFRGLTPLTDCARTGNVAMMKLLLGATRGAALHSTDDENCSALHWAAKEGQLETVDLLVKAGVDAEAADMEGRTAADVAREAGHDEVADLLEKAMGEDWESEY